MSGWIGVDLDGTLAHYEGWNNGEIGEPLVPMLERVKEWLSNGMVVKIVTARVAPGPDPRGGRADIEAWCLKHIGRVLEVTCQKDFGMIELWDDRVIQVMPNIGEPLHDTGARDLANCRRERYQKDRKIRSLRGAIDKACSIIELGDQRLLAGDGPAGGLPPDLSLAEWKLMYTVLDKARKDSK